MAFVDRGEHAGLRQHGEPALLSPVLEGRVILEGADVGAYRLDVLEGGTTLSRSARPMPTP